MLELTDSQKIRAIATAADCPEDAPFDVVVAAVRGLVEDREALNRIVGMVLGVVPARRIDAMIDRLMSRRPKKGK